MTDENQVMQWITTIRDDLSRVNPQRLVRIMSNVGRHVYTLSELEQLKRSKRPVVLVLVRGNRPLLSGVYVVTRLTARAFKKAVDANRVRQVRRVYENKTNRARR